MFQNKHGLDRDGQWKSFLKELVTESLRKFVSLKYALVTVCPIQNIPKCLTLFTFILSP